MDIFNKDDLIAEVRRRQAILDERDALVEKKKAEKLYKASVSQPKRRRLQLKLRGIALLGNKCEKCGILYPPAAMHFHHKDPTTKTMTLSREYLRCRWETIEAELKLCSLLCANCHAIEHHKDDLGGSMDAYLLP